MADAQTDFIGQPPGDRPPGDRPPGDRPGGTFGTHAAIGPNAVTQLIAALKRAGLAELAPPIFRSAGVAEWLAHPPDAMVDERGVARLHQAVRAALPPGQARAVMTDAGRLTADYLLANRIPRPVKLLLKLLPARLAAILLVRAIRGHAWTFAGSGTFFARAGSPAVFDIVRNPVCAGETAIAPACAWHAAVFQRLFEILVSRDTLVAETDCEACGDGRCRFVVDWRRRPISRALS